MYVILLYCILSVLTFYSLFTNKISRRTQSYIMLAVALFALFRFSLGPDTRTYCKLFNELPLEFAASYDYYNARFPLFSVLMKTASVQGLDYAAFQFCSNLVVLMLICAIIYKKSENILMSLMLFIGSGVFQVYFTSAARQMLCMAIFFFAFYKYLLNKKYWVYYLFMILAFYIHEASLFTLVLPILHAGLSYFTSKHGKILIGTFWVIAFLGLNVGIQLLMPAIPMYWQTYLQACMNRPISIAGLGLQVVLMGMILWFLRYESFESLPESLRFQILVCVYSFAIYTIFVRMPLSSRVCDYLNMIHLILIPSLVVRLKQPKALKLACIGLFALNGVLLYVDVRDTARAHYFDSSIMHYPYVSIFDVDRAYEVYDFGDHRIR